MIAERTVGQEKRIRTKAAKRIKRLKILARDNFACAYCGKDLLASPEDYANATIDHVVPVSRGGGSALSNLVACCSACNQLKSNIHVEDLEHARAVLRQRRLTLVLKHAALTEWLRGARGESRANQMPPLVMNPVDLATQLTATANALRAVASMRTRERPKGLWGRLLGKLRRLV